MRPVPMVLLDFSAWNFFLQVAGQESWGLRDLGDKAEGKDHPSRFCGWL